MRIGILTFHRAHNYGALLQCYALYTVINKLGYDVKIIDYRQPFIESNYTPISLTIIKRDFRTPKKLIRYIFDCFKRKKRQILFESFVQRNIVVTTAKNNIIPEDFDLYIIGSDQLWSSKYAGHFDEIYFGEFPIAEKSIRATYAISADISSLEQIDAKVLKKYLLNFYAISVREPILARAIEKKTGIRCNVDLDPVMLTEPKDWDRLISNKWESLNYIAIYQIHFPDKNKSILNIIANRLAERYNCHVIDLTPKMYSPEDFVSIIKHAKYVLTTSFHGTAFSLLFHKNFYTISVNSIVDQRALSLLKSVGLEDRLCNYRDIKNMTMVNYTMVDEKMDALRNKSVEYIKRICNENTCNM